MEAQIVSRQLPHINSVLPLNNEDIPVMQELYQVLKKHNYLKRFGVTLLHEHFLVNDDEVLVELTDIKTRTQIIKPFKKTDPDIIDAIETSWRLDTGLPVTSCKCIKRQGQEHQHESVGY